MTKNPRRARTESGRGARINPEQGLIRYLNPAWGTGVLAFILLALIMAVLRIQAADQTAIEGSILDKSTRLPVPDAQVTLDPFGLSTTTGSDGRFRWNAVPLDADMQTATIRISRAGYGDWTLQDVRVLRDETLIIEAELTQEPQTIVVPPLPGARPAGFAADTDIPHMLQMLGGAEDIALPATIRVRVTGNAFCNTGLPYTVETIDFKEYVKHVLPNEWIPSWPWESLRAGAMAAKMYAWYWIALGGKWNDADVYDSTCDQVYNPAVSYASTNQAVDDTWNWRLTRADQLIQTQYRAYEYQCGSADCMGQWDSRDLALSGWTWDEILFSFYEGTQLTEVWDPPGGYSLRYDGIYNDNENRVLIAIDDPADSSPGPPVDVGAADFTLEFWIKANPGENNAPAATCGENTAWQQGNLLFDRDRMDADRDYGLSLANGRAVFGVSGEGTGDLSICGSSSLVDGTWHHVAVQRRLSDGYLWLFVDGLLEAEGDGPDGDVSYPDDYIPGSTCGPSGAASCTPFDPFLALGAEKHRQTVTSPSFNGWLDEVRFSSVLRYSTDFTPPALPFTADADTVALYHFDEGVGNLIHDSSGAAGGPSDGDRIYGGSVNGPEWSLDTVWYVPPPTPTPTPTYTPTPTNTPTPTPAAVRFAVIGDFGNSGQPEQDVSNLVRSWNPDLILTTGDNNYPDGSAATIDSNIGQYYSDYIFPYTGSFPSSATENRFYPSLGNHDWYSSGAAPYLDYFTLPGNERYYDFTVGPVHFFALDSDINEPDGISSQSTQAQWLQTGLSQSTSIWNIVYFHHPPYSSGPHGNTAGMQWPFETWGADAVISGHDHTYERLTIGGIPYFVNGLGGMSIYGFGTPTPGSVLRYNTDYGAMLVDATESQIHYQFIDRTGQIIDTIVQVAGQPMPIFSDVPADHWAFETINALFEAGYISGCSAQPRLYCPDQVLTRAEAAVFLLRGQYGTGASIPYPPPATPTFVDVAPSFWAYSWIESLWTDGFTAGCGVNPLRYCPLESNNRAQASVFFLRAKHGSDYQPPLPSGIFTDIQDSAWYAAWAEAAYAEGLLPACNQDPLEFCPLSLLDRSWAAYMMVQSKGGLPLP